MEESFALKRGKLAGNLLLARAIVSAVFMVLESLGDSSFEASEYDFLFAVR